MQANVFIPTQQAFEDILERKVESLLQRKIPEIVRRASRKEYITTKEFEELTGCSYRVQSYLRTENKIPYSQEGRKIFYRTEDVEKFMDERRIEPQSA